jgi:hypothetical protein
MFKQAVIVLQSFIQAVFSLLLVPMIYIERFGLVVKNSRILNKQVSERLVAWISGRKHKPTQLALSGARKLLSPVFFTLSPVMFLAAFVFVNYVVPLLFNVFALLVIYSSTIHLVSSNRKWFAEHFGTTVFSFFTPLISEDVLSFISAAIPASIWICLLLSAVFVVNHRFVSSDK